MSAAKVEPKNPASLARAMGRSSLFTFLSTRKEETSVDRLVKEPNKEYTKVAAYELDNTVTVFQDTDPHSPNFHPIKIAPEDILHEIFKWLVLMDETRDTGLILGRVCRLWRHIALSTPQLWAYIRFSPIGAPSLEMMLMYWNTMISRAHSAPVTIDFYTTSGLPGEDVLSSFPLEGFQNISCIIIKFQTTEELRTYDDWITSRHIIVKRLERLEIIGQKPGSGPWMIQAAGLNLFHIVALLSPSILVLNHLRFDVGSYLGQYGAQAIPSVRGLHLSEIHFDMDRIDKLPDFFPGLKRFHGESFTLIESLRLDRHQRLTDLELHPYISSFDRTGPPIRNLERLKMSRTATIFLNGLQIFYGFLRAHGTIKTLELFQNVEGGEFSFRFLAIHVPQITHLTVSSRLLIGLVEFLAQTFEDQQKRSEQKQKLLSPFPLLECLTIFSTQMSYPHYGGAVNRVEQVKQNFFIRLLNQMVRNRWLEMARDDAIGTIHPFQTARVPPFRFLRLQDGLKSCPELDRLPYSTLYTDDGIFREFTFSEQLRYYPE